MLIFRIINFIRDIVVIIFYLYYKSKDEVSLVEVEKQDSPSNQLDQDDLYKDLEDLFI